MQGYQACPLKLPLKKCRAIKLARPSYTSSKKKSGLFQIAQASLKAS
jgi:hypothetical protein